MDPLIIVFGLGVGVLVGLTGIGGGSLMTPLLLLVIGTQPIVAVGTDIAYGALTKTVGGWQHLRSGTVDLGVSGWLALGSVPGSVGGVILVENLPSPPDTALLWGVAGALAFTRGRDARARAVRAARRRAGARDGAADAAHEGARGRRSGLVLGFILGVTSVGSGALIGLALILVFRLTPHRVVGTDVFHAAVLLWAAGLAHVVAGNVDYGLMGEHPDRLAARRGHRRAAARASCRRPGCARRSACTMLAAALGVGSKAGLDLPALAIVGPPLLAGAGAYALTRARRRARAPSHAAASSSPT